MKKFRKKIYAVTLLICILGCFSSCAAFQKSASEKSQEPQIKNIILIIGDGMGLEHISAGQLTSGKVFDFTNWQYTLANTNSVDTAGKGAFLTDSAASGTALATGELTVNRYLGKNHNGEDLTTILDLASEKYGKATGIVTTDTLLGATPGAFSAHTQDRSYTLEIFQTQINSGVDLLCGAIELECVNRKDAIEEAGYSYYMDFDSVGGDLQADKAYWMFDMAGDTAKVALKDAAVQALNYLGHEENGFVLMIEEAYIDKESTDNNFEAMEKRVNSLNDTVGAVMDWMGDRKDTAIIITSDHECGGLSVGSNDRYANTYMTTDGKEITYQWSSDYHTNANVGVFVYGFQEDFSQYDYYASHHLIKNTDIYRMMEKLLEESKQERIADKCQ